MSCDEPLTCDVCKKNEALGVACSAFGPVSFAYCRECLMANRDSYGAIVGGLIGCDDENGALHREYIRADLLPCIDASLAFHGKAWDDLERDVHEGTTDYLKSMSSEVEE